MSGKGGKGRGRGRGGGGNMAVHDLLRSNAEDLGIEHDRGSSLGQQPPPVWPEIEGGIPALLPMTQHDRDQIEIQRRITKRIRDSPYFLKDVKKVPDVIRWSDRHSVRDVKYEKFHQAIASSSKCMPPELLDVNGSKSSLSNSDVKKRFRTNSLSEKELQALAEIEGKLPAGRSEQETKRSGSDEEGQDENAAEDEFDQDYLENHYESADDDDGGNDSGGESYL
jgi:hypothetical protein